MLTALNLSVLAARVVVTERQDFASHLTGINRQDIFFGTSNSVYDLLSKVPFPRQELEGLDKLKGNYRVEEVHFKAEKREDTNLEKEEVRLTEEEWVDQLASMTSREQSEMEKFLGGEGRHPDHGESMEQREKELEVGCAGGGHPLPSPQEREARRRAQDHPRGAGRRGREAQVVHQDLPEEGDNKQGRADDAGEPPGGGRPLLEFT